MQNISELHAIFYGRVQGVFFRVTIRNIAKQLNVKGYVKNLSDGAVELIAQASKDILDTLIDSIQNKPGYASIDKIEKKYVKPTKIFDEFKIIY